MSQTGFFTCRTLFILEVTGWFCIVVNGKKSSCPALVAVSQVATGMNCCATAAVWYPVLLTHPGPQPMKRPPK